MNGHAYRVRGLFTIPLIWCMIGFLLFSALISRERDLILLCVCFFGLGGLTWAWGRLSPKGIRLAVDLDRERLFPGESASLSVTVENRKIIPVWINICFPQPIGRDASVGLPSSEIDAALPGYGNAAFERAIRFHRRGVYRVGPEQLITGDFLGLFPRFTPAGIERELIVYPRLRPFFCETAAKTDTFGSPGSGGLVTDPAYVVGTREYRAGNPARFIHWRASARHRKWQEKLFQPSSGERVILALDTKGFDDAQDERGFERVIEAAAWLSVQLDRSGARFGFVSNGRVQDKHTHAVVAAGSRRSAPILEALARLKMRPAGSLQELMSLYAPSLGGRTVALFCRERDEVTRDLRSLLKRNRKKVVVYTAAALSGDKRAVPTRVSVPG